ncbi:MAG: hypothetical protein HY955_07970 [Deltaproteobacteria bacterium]|nr:hypothetical protein [Deltaproteobacteria bacterium]
MKRNLLIMAATFVLAGAVIYIKSTIHPPVPEPVPAQGERLVFEFVASRTDDGIFIESAVKEGLKKKGGKAPEGAGIFRIDYDYIKDSIGNAPDGGYTAAGGFRLVDFKTEGFYYNADKKCGDGHVTIKLVSEEVSTLPEDFVVIRKPYPKLNGFESLVYEEQGIAPALREKAEAFLKERFERLKTESPGPGRKLDNGPVYKGPRIAIYGPRTGTGPLFMTANWPDEGKEASCCVSGVFVAKDGGLSFDEFLPLSRGPGADPRGITRLFRLSGQEFVFVTGRSQDGSASGIYEYRDKERGRLYQGSRPRGGC